MKLDAHQHFWRYNPEEFGWIDDAMAAIRRDFLPEDLSPVIGAQGLEGTVAVQARQTLEETRWLLGLAERHSIIKGVVGWVPLADGRLAGILDLISDRRLVGVRHVVQGEADPRFLEGEAFNAGIRTITGMDLTYDLLIYANQLSAAIAFVDRHPRQRFVLDHIAKPRIERAPPEDWRRQLTELARRQNVYCKFSGVITEVPGWRWDLALLEPYFKVVLDAFGPRRLMFGSDWPVCLVGSTYARWFEAVSALAAGLAPAERARLMGETAAEAYRIPPHP
jgi:L-fuconolactonase